VILHILFRREARDEFDRAADWYEQRRTGRGAKFTAAVRKVLKRAAEQPDFYAKVHGEVHEALVSGYPYCVYYLVDGEAVVVIAVFHSARDPDVWRSRVR
jgi:toxin ParE1/3/4